MLAILTSKLGLAGIALALVLSVIGIQTARLHHATAEISSMKAAQKLAEADVRAHEANASAISAQATQSTAAERVRVQTVTRTLIEKVPAYVDAKSDAACTVGTGFVSVFDAAARGDAEISRPPGGSGGSPSGVPLSAVLSTTVEDFGVAYGWRAEALGWRDWYRREAAAWASK